MERKYAPISYSGMNRRGVNAQVSVQATHAYEPSKNNVGSFCPLKDRTFWRKLPLKEICPPEIVSLPKGDFKQFAKDFPEFKKELTFLAKLQRKINESSIVRWDSICLGYKIDKSDPNITLAFVSSRVETLAQAEALVDKIINEDWA